MTNTVVYFKRSLAVAALVLFGACQSQAANGTWYSTNSVYANAYWTNSWNWSASPYPAGNQVATFNNNTPTNGGRYTIDVTGLTVISNIVFDTAGVPSYVIGSNGVNQQTLVITNGGIIQVTQTAANSQLFNTAMVLGPDTSAATYTFRNDHPINTLTFAGSLSTPLTGGTAGAKTLNIAGIGDVLLGGNVSTNGVSTLTITDTSVGTVTLAGGNKINTINANGGTFTVSGTNRIDTITATATAPFNLLGTNFVANLNANANAPFVVSGTNTFTTINVGGNGPLNMYGSNIVTTLNISGTGSSVVNVVAGTLMVSDSGTTTISATQDAVINGPGAIYISTGGGENYGDNGVANGKTVTINAKLTGNTGFEYYNPSTFGTFVLNGTNDFTQNVIINGGPATISVSKINNRGVPGNLGAGTSFIFGSGNFGRLLYTGTGETTDRTIDIRTNGIIEVSGTGNLKFVAPVTVAAGGSRTLILQGSTSGTGEFGGPLINSSGVLGIIKAGTGTWTLSTNNTYTGSTVINGGTLALTGAYGTISSSSGLTVSNGTIFVLSNTASANNTNRLADTIPVTLNGGTFSFSNDGSSATFSENVGAVTLGQNANTLATAQAASGQTATLRLASLTRTTGATVNFTGTGLGVDDRNRLFIAGQANGLIGPWATVNGSNLAAYSSSQGVYAAADVAFTDIAARGPSTIVSNDTSSVRINTDGTSGPIELDSVTTRIASLLQNTATPATVNTAAKTLQTSGIIVPAGKASVTIGQLANDGALAPVAASGELTLNNGSASALTVNAVIADNGASSKLTKAGAGTVTLAASNTLSGTLSANGGPLVLANSAALQNATLGTSGTAFDSSVASHAFTVGGLNNAFNLTLSDNASSPNAVTLSAGKNNADTTYSGVLSGAGALNKIGSGTLTLSGSNTFSGGLTVSAGTLTASTAGSLGSATVVNNGTLNLTGASDITYTGLSAGLSGYGTNNVTVGTGSQTVYLQGNYAGFTGLWNVGIGAAAGAAKVYMNGADTPAATINVMSNATLYTSAGTHYASAILRGGDTGELYGQLRLETGANWAGPVTLAGDITTGNDGLIGGNSGIGTISGVISDLGGIAHPVSRVGAGTTAFLGTNTYGGQTWVRQGTLAFSSVKNVGAGASALGAPANPANGTIRIGSNTVSATLSYVGMGDSSDRAIDMAGTTGGATLDHSGTNALTLTGGMTASIAGNKTFTLQGSTIGTGEFAGAIPNVAGSMISLVKAGTGTWKLSAANTFTGGVNVTGGTLIAGHANALGAGESRVAIPSGTGVVLDFANDGNGETPYIMTINSAATAPTLKSNRQTPGAGVSHHLGLFHISTVTLTVTNGDNVVSGAPSFNIDTIDLFSGASGTTVLMPTTADLLLGSVTIISNSFAKTLQLDGSSLGNAITGPISNGLNSISLIKANSSVWTLYGSNSYNGATAINGGRLVLSGTNGAILGTSGITLTGGSTLVLDNAEATNNINRLIDSAPITMNGGVLNFSHNAGAMSYSETAGALSIAQSTNLLIAAQAAGSGYTSVVTFVSLSRTVPATVNFLGAGLGADERNQIRFGTPPTLVSGLIGPWATVNGTDLATYGTYGVTAYTNYTDLAARGPNSVISNDSTVNARINLPGDNGPITLGTSPVSSVNTLLQNTDTAAVVTTTNTLFRTAGILIGAGKGSLTIGTTEGEGAVSALTSGGDLVLANKSANSILTINAPVSNNTSASSLSKSGLGKVILTGSNSYSGATAIYDGTLEFGGSSTQTIAGVISGSGALVKSGTGKLTLPGANTYSGLTTIKTGGILVVTNNASLGSTTAGTVIEAGATLDVGGSPAGTGNGLVLGAEPITVSGAGVNGRGAIINSSNISQYNVLRYVTLAGDTTFGGDSVGRWDLRNINGTATLTMNDFTLTKVGTNQFGLTGVTVYPGTGNVNIAEGNFTMEVGTLMNGTSNNLMTVQNGATLDLYQIYSPIVWSMILNDGARVYTRSSVAPTQNIWSGPVLLNGRAILDGVGNTTNTLSGNITGTGPLIRTGAAGALTFLTSSNNTYSGNTVISNGTLSALYTGSLPGYDSGKLTVVGPGTLLLPTGDGVNGWSLAQIFTLLDITSFTNSTATLALDTTQTGLVIDRAITNTLSLTKQGTNSITLNGMNTYAGTTRVLGGVLTLSSVSSNNIGPITVSGSGPGALLNVNGTTIMGTNDTQVVTVGAANTDRSTAIITTNMLMGKLLIGNAAGANGAVIQNSGDLVVAPNRGSTDVVSLGNGGSGYGYYRMNGGTLTTAMLALPSSGGGNAAFDLYDGTVNVAGTLGWLIFGWSNGNSALNMFGGSINAPAGNEVSMSHTASKSALSMINMLGANAFLNTTGSKTNIGLRLSTSAGNVASVVNLNSGAILANRVYAGVTTTPSLFSFNGGTLKVNPGSVYASTFLQGLTAATVYPNGAVIDTTNAEVVVAQSLQAPNALGVTGYNLTNVGAGYLGAPVVQVSGGIGTGATAIASVDLNTNSVTYGKVTGLQATCPGFGYTSRDILTVTLSGGGYTTLASATAVIGANSSSGGLTKLGSGALTLAGTNTYGGTTTISNGTIRLGVANALPSNANVLVANGIFDLGGFTVTNGNVTVLSGAVANGTLIGNSLTKAGSGTATLSVSETPTGPILITAGKLQLSSKKPGLYEGRVAGSADTATVNPKTATPITTRYANIAFGDTTAGGIWTNNTTFIYTGYLWNSTGTNATWTFAKNFDDFTLLKIDGTAVLNNGTWNTPVTANYALTPGAHAFELRLGQGGGGVGPNIATWWTSMILGVGFDPLGRNLQVVGNYQPLTDPGDGSLLTISDPGYVATNLISTAATVDVSANAVLDLGGTLQTLAGITGAGQVTNGTFAVNGVIAPGGTNVIGTLSIAAATTLSGTLLVDIASGGASDLVAVRGNVNLASLALQIANPDQLDRQKQYTILTCTGTRTGTFSSNNFPNSRWHVVYGADGSVKLVFVDGTLLKLL